MQKPNLDNVRQHFEQDGWEVEIDYSGDHITLSADIVQTGRFPDTAEFFRADFAFRQQDMEHSDLKHLDGIRRQVELEDIQDYAQTWRDKINYHGSPAAVQFYEAEFGESSAADVQVVSYRTKAELKENLAKVQGKSVAAVESAFKGAGYTVDLYPSDKGTAQELWQVKCMMISPYLILVAMHSQDAGTARIVAEANIPAAQMQNMELKLQDNWFYYGSPEAIHLFEALGGGPIEVLYAPAPVSQEGNESTLLETAFKEAGYMVTLVPMGETTMITGSAPGTTNMIMAMMCSSPEEAQASSANYAPSAEALNMEIKCRGNWFYYGSPDAVSVFERVVK